MVRSTSGCTNCKRRKRKCDEVRPECGLCRRRGIKCDGYVATVRWANGVASRGQFSGATIPDKAALEKHTNRSNGLANIEPPSPDNDNTTEAPPPPGTSNQEWQEYRKFLTSGLCRLYSTEVQSWMQPFFEEVAMESRALVLVGGALQRFLEDNHGYPLAQSLEAIGLALQTFRTELESRHNAIQVGTICAGILICTIHPVMQTNRYDTLVPSGKPLHNTDSASRQSLQYSNINSYSQSLPGTSSADTARA
ncbi:uncharacterized protein CTRU02_202874 [Colletotrichum truncatum]|uniref:Uncharacterized protein n=1 Tax=Colletotrichum truncatum TaxID=5467 RepID=A0ACC3ZLI1_COLTU|nr:uncharacterized protein CTRU02_12967 [Colletotrichum truncatum]KAF6783951.1 hypothetical protein CTRU02_12967 [Colletotrichum truncatum]